MKLLQHVWHGFFWFLDKGFFGRLARRLRLRSKEGSEDATSDEEEAPTPGQFQPFGEDALSLPYGEFYFYHCESIPKARQAIRMYCEGNQ